MTDNANAPGRDQAAMRARLRALPPIDRLLEHELSRAPIASTSRPAVTAALRRALADARDALRRDGADPATVAAAVTPDAPTLIRRAAATLAAENRPGLRPVINATGIVLHTNLGRAPLAPEAAAAAAAVAGGYATLEYDLGTGERGARGAAVEALLRATTGADAAVAVNNAAAAVLLALGAHAGVGGEVVVSRGELVEIGGGFRIPDVIRQGGAVLREVGTTNRTRIGDYEAAIGPDTRVLLKVHPSNFRVVGFTAEASGAELAALARARGLRFVHDLGSGLLTDPRPGTAPDGHETAVRAAVAAGADLVLFSGDKLLGGPQAGLAVGRADAVDPLRRHPLMRALRLDKMTLAALEATLRLHLGDGRDARLRIPVLRMLSQDVSTLDRRAERLREQLARSPFKLDLSVVPSEAEAGGGALPGLRVPSRALAIGAPGGAESPGAPSPDNRPAPGVDTLLARLRAGDPPVIGRAVAGRVLLDLFAVPDDAIDALADAVSRAAAPNRDPDPPLP